MPLSSAPLRLQPRATTGIAGLDNVLGGGLPRGHLYLIEGSPGAGKTTLGLQFLLEGRAKGEAGLYITLSETRSELGLVAESHGWALDGLDIFELVSEEGLSPDAEQSILYPSEVELGETTRAVMDTVRRQKPDRVVFDSLSEMRLLAQDPLRYRRQILALKHFFATQGATVLMLDDMSGSKGEGDLQLHSIAHGVVALDQSMADYGPVRRHLRVVKMRGVRYRGGEHDLSLDTGGLSVFPRLIAAEHRSDVESSFVSTGTAALDTLLGYLGAKAVVLAGVAGNNCVLFTANDAYMRDFHLVVPADCVASNTAEDNEYALRQMRDILKADIRPSAEIDLEALKSD